ncbi:MAG: Glyoxalase/Bleomycin resistance protein/Dioxygenase superfamily [Pseudomonadota bacterium]|jgi:catechol 2,3-dioxygenase-like lactoylglutathione lyase family enzyme
MRISWSLVLLVTLGFPLRAQPAPEYAAIDHVEFFVADLSRSLDFYTRVFGSDLWKNTQSERRYLQLGQSYIALEQLPSEQNDTVRVDHICFGIRDFAIDAMHAWLDAQDIPWQDYPSGRDLHVDDNNGIRTQLAQSPTWQQLSASTAAPEPRDASGGAPIFDALAIDEVFLMVDDLEVDSLFYSRLLNVTGALQQGSLWYAVGTARLRLTQAPVGQIPGVNYFAVRVAATDMEAAADKVFAAGGIVETILPNGFSFWDPDGLRVVVRTLGD